MKDDPISMGSNDVEKYNQEVQRKLDTLRKRVAELLQEFRGVETIERSVLASNVVADALKQRLEYQNADMEAFRRTIAEKHAFFKGVGSLLLVAMSVLFGYQLFQASQVTQAVDTMHHKLREAEKLQDSASKIIKNSTRVAEYGRLMQSAHLSLNRKRHFIAYAQAQKAIEQIEPILREIPLRGDSGNGNAELDSSGNDHEVVSVDHESGFERSCRRMMVDAIGLQFIAMSAARESSRLPELAQRMVEADKYYHVGYVYRGLIRSESPNLQKEALDDMVTAANLEGGFSLAKLNLAEIYFTLGQYEKCLHTCSELRKHVSDGHIVGVSTDVIALDVFYQMSNFLNAPIVDSSESLSGKSSQSAGAAALAQFEAFTNAIVKSDALKSLLVEPTYSDAAIRMMLASTEKYPQEKRPYIVTLLKALKKP